ncbi:hypothetical protein M3Y98_00263800 [Aphelenchoides besseyi]|nr:hypothetical protein M3Y98_00263800 [Aphelenchoides besseyi]KAI6200888.1 hypothetical protein M3Y96_00782300 [Aphelenchoides besseyi]
MNCLFLRVGFLLIGCLFQLVVGQNFETGDNSTVRDCSTHCTYKDGDLRCWEKNQIFFEKLLLGQMRHYIAVQINIDQFRQRHEKEAYKPDFDGMRDESIKRISSYLTPEDYVTTSTIKTVVHEARKMLLMQRVENKSQKAISWIPHYSCPLPCEYRFNSWRNLFIASMIINVCLGVAVVPYVYNASKRDSSEALL